MIKDINFNTDFMPVQRRGFDTYFTIIFKETVLLSIRSYAQTKIYLDLICHSCLNTGSRITKCMHIQSDEFMRI